MLIFPRLEIAGFNEQTGIITCYCHSLVVNYYVTFESPQTATICNSIVVIYEEVK